ncbi:hypothetical protein OCH239_08105 [Roseivivax halodurans JCM 10272]|uniref:AB hydrolase-1 domain-containing protein n=1 Tax=Roseivivax halodurans JCM 10272 TaxID=1449350 RepID=X7EJL7_9RHOB|nr:alpha/beta hydrolase [Roseivivax halodurans]ETX16112.1 hypothetical protein OCH239_08105 [Roseivivax halodurans JCM 10272]
MPVIRVSARNGIPGPAGGPQSLSRALDAALSDPSVGAGPVTVMVHGFKYAPGCERHCPHETIFSLTPRFRDVDRRIVSWPRHLGFGRPGPDRGLAISFGWPARGSIWNAYDNADRAGDALARLLAELRERCPHTPLHAVGHSLGARVVLDALTKSAPGALDWALLLAPAEFSAPAHAAVESPAGRTAKVLAVTSRENDVFDLMMELFVSALRRGDSMLGHRGLRASNALTMQIDHAPTLAALRAAGHRLGAPEGRVCHWSPYLRPGAFPLYRAIIEGRLSFSRLRAILPEDTDPRWARILPRFATAQTAPG